jgi:glucan phosphorylase
MASHGTRCRQQDPKFVYYLSAEFLMGRTLTNAVSAVSLRW